MDYAMHNVVAFDIDRDEILGLPGGFLGVRRLHLRNRRDDGTHSPPFVCDFVVRPVGVDAAVVAVWHRDPAGRITVLLRDGLRPALSVGRAAASLPVPDGMSHLPFTEVVAGIIERQDAGEAGIRQRAALEVGEEAGYRVDADAVQFLGAGTFPSPGSMPEKFWLMAVHVQDPDAQGPLTGDGSPMEEGARTRWMGLQDAIEACVEGTIADAKTELVLRRLKDALSDG